MIDKITYLETDSEKFPLAFTLNVMEALQNEYGTLSEWSELIRNQKEPNIKALKFFITEAINEGIDIENGSQYAAPSGRYRCADEQEKTQRTTNENEQGDNVFDRGIRRKFITMKEAGRIITEIGLKKVANTITKMITESMPHNEKSKKVKATKNQKI